MSYSKFLLNFWGFSDFFLADSTSLTLLEFSPLFLTFYHFYSVFCVILFLSWCLLPCSSLCHYVSYIMFVSHVSLPLNIYSVSFVSWYVSLCPCWFHYFFLSASQPLLLLTFSIPLPLTIATVAITDTFFASFM